MSNRRFVTYRHAPITHSILNESLVGYNRPNDKISHMIEQGDLISLRRGLYVPGPESGVALPHSFLIANHLRGPSYITRETALSYWGLIPERVHEISSATMKTAKVYDTEVGRFSYSHLPSPYFSYGVLSETVGENQVARIASPEKALCDTIVLTRGVNLRSLTQTLDYLLEDMRIDEDELITFQLDQVESWLSEAPKRSSLGFLIKAIQKLSS